MSKQLGIKKERQFVKVAAVLLRDHTTLRLDEVLEQLIYCWRHTESIEQAERREART